MYEALKQILQNGRRIFFGGAGVSTESGIPISGRNQPYHAENRYASPPELPSEECFSQQPELFYSYYREN